MLYLHTSKQTSRCGGVLGVIKKTADCLSLEEMLINLHHFSTAEKRLLLFMALDYYCISFFFFSGLFVRLLRLDVVTCILFAAQFHETSFRESLAWSMLNAFRKPSYAPILV